MTVKLLLPILFFFFAIGLFSFQENKSAKINKQTSFDTTKNYLALYGKNIFIREGCIKCHILTQTNNKDIISLDGLQQRGISNSWHFKHLQNPSSMIDNSLMPSFDYLNNKLIHKDSLLFINTLIKDSIWTVLLEAANTIFVDLKKANIVARPKSEMIALIAYLQSIPASDELTRKNILEKERLLVEDKKWDSLFKNLNSILYTTAIDSNNISLGKNIFQSTCWPCHGKQGEGGVGPNLTDEYWLHGSSYSSITKTIIYGVPDRGMVSWRFQLTPIKIGQLVAYVKSLKNTNPQNAKIRQGVQE